MERLLHERLAVELWRAFAGPTGLDAAVTAAAATLAHHIPLDWLAVRRIDAGRSCLETVAVAPVGGGLPPERGHDHLPVRTLERLVAGCRTNRGRGLRRISNGDSLAAALPAAARGGVLAAPLTAAGEPLGVLLVAPTPGHELSAEQIELAAIVVEPCAAALAVDRLVHRITTEREAAEAARHSLLARLGHGPPGEVVVGVEGGLVEVMERVEQVAVSDVPVLILGETGSGKEVIARAIHQRSRRHDGPFLRVNCGAIPPELVDSELFGHERGSFTGASHLRKGWFERADGGTLLLDEVAELSAAAQVRLLRVLQDGSFERVGGQRQLTADVRVVAATHRDLAGMVGEGRFREDLWYRLAVFAIDLPALRERPEDLPALAAHFAQRACRRFGLPPMTPTRADLGLLGAYSWPGNVRELQTVIDRAAILGDGERLDIAAALGRGAVSVATAPPETRAPGPSTAPSPELATLDEVVRRHIERALAETQGRIEGRFGAARLLAVNPHTLRSRMRRLGVDWRRFRARAPGDR
ncbi:MAG: sigma-54 dependent transcriptional regulator [Thermoanaerobaculales bacterium]|jgi:transcriptional regulator with GAF, ATPase, and Fis domain|nr:sigma-54 dependent transcriptional regulator [Thermoanaerobaculales bacterium]